jgi:cellulose synthase/poly-beta-1,6-N-acetylglucosamine synthase-like glycosyltransferase
MANFAMGHLMNPWTWLFWIACAVIVYTYAGYGLLVYMWVRWCCPQRLQPPPSPATADLPALTLVVAAYNEAAIISTKLSNSLELDYPRDRLQFVFVTDGSDDGSERLLQEQTVPPDCRLRVLHEAPRQGKLAAVDRVMPTVTTPVTVYSDANAMLNRQALRNIVKHYADPTVGAVAGEKRVQFEQSAGAEGVGEGLYWRYESTLKRLDAALYSVVGAAGELFSMRTALYESPPPDTVLEDFFLSLRVAMRGYRVAYAPDAYAVEGHSASLGEEFKRKVRNAAGGLQAIIRMPELLYPWRHGLLTFQYVSHRVLRWTLAPLLLPVVFVANLALLETGSLLYGLLMVGQLLFYGAALFGWLLEQLGVKIKLFYIPMYFCLMNYSVYAGAFRLLRRQQSVVWEKVQRA